MQKAFTMIEVIFVIVIIGILAAVAIPKLSATRDDAKISSEVASAKQVILNLGSEYASQAAFVNYTIAEAEAETNCFTVTPSGTDGLTIEPISSPSSSCPLVMLTGASHLASLTGIIKSDKSTKTYHFGGIRIVK